MIWVELLACVVIWLSFWSLIPRDEWWFRGADFPRLQILALGLIAFILMLLWDAPWDWVREAILIGLIAAVAYQLKMVLPYTFVWKKQVKTVAKTELQPECQISLIVSNVLTPNTQYSISLIAAADSSVSTRLDFDFRVRCTLATSLECTGR